MVWQTLTCPKKDSICHKPEENNLLGSTFLRHGYLAIVGCFAYICAMQHWKFIFITFGCKVNQYETQSLREAWSALGGEECSAPSLADVLCINSCAITAKGERDARNAVYRLRREAPEGRIILTGCSARLFAAYTPRANAIWAQPDLIVPQEEKYRLLAGPWVDMEDSPTEGEKTVTAFPPFRIAGFTRARPVLKVQDGCAHRCTYCIVPQTRGKPRSRPVRDIIDEARLLLASGHAELMISGINLAQYGRDSDTGDFWSLLRSLDEALAPEFAGRARLRISSLEPGQLNRRGLDVLRSCSMLCPHLHISLQHASQVILKRMGRGHYTPIQLENALTELASHWPVMGLGADIIVGFPGETEEDLRMLLELIERLPLSYAHVFPYSARPGTAAANFAGQIPHAVKLQRAARVRTLVEQKKKSFLQAQCTLSRMLVAPEKPSHALGKVKAASDTADLASPEHSCEIKGVNEYYVACSMPIPQGAVQGTDLPQGLLAVRPVSWHAQGLVVEPLEEQHSPPPDLQTLLP